MAKVLLVEDDNNLREIYEARLTAEGYEIITAQNGEEALSAAKQYKPDLVISDVMMPRISGFEMLDILRNTNELKHTKVIMLTALGQSEDRYRADNLGADKYLVKSQVTLEDIVNAAKELLSDESDTIMPNTFQPVTALPTSDPVQSTATPVDEDEDEQPAEDPEPVETSSDEAAMPQPADTSYEVEPTAAVSVATTPMVEPPTESSPATTPMPDEQSTASPTPPVNLNNPTEPPTDTNSATVPTAALQQTPPVAPVAPSITGVPPVAGSATVLDEPVLPGQDTTVAPLVPPINTTVTVADPDPIAPHVSPPAEVLDYPDTATPAADALLNPPAPAQPISPVAAATVTDGGPQTLAAEEAAIQEQINSFATTEQPTAPSSASANNDAVLDDAISKLTATPESASTVVAAEQPEVPDQAVPTEQPTQPVTAADNSSQISGHKVIQPLAEGEISNTPNLQELVAQEEAKEAARTNAASQSAANTPPAASSPANGFDPNSIAL